MRRTPRILVAAALLAASAAAQDTAAFVDVTVVPMTGPDVLPGCTVVVRDGLIRAVGPAATTEVPPGALRIDGKGRYLMPGLADMHVHVWYEEELLLYVANGVTAVRNMWGTEQHAQWWREIRAGERLGPAFYTTGPITDGSPPIWAGSKVVTNVRDARAHVKEQAMLGARAIKVYNRLRPEVYEAIVAEARRWDLKVEGHVPFGMDVERVLALRQDSIEHLDGYVGWFNDPDPERLRDLAARTARAGTWSCPTLVVWTKFVPQEEAARMAALPEMRFVPPRLRATWRPDRDFRLKDMKPAHWEAMTRTQETRRTVVRLLKEAGAPILLGTDAGNPFVVAGWAVREELAELMKAGLTPYEALRAGTADAGRYLGAPFGTVEPGRRADLLLLDANPLEDVAHVARRAGVMVRGRWLPSGEIERRLEELAAGYERPRRRLDGLPELAGGPARRFAVRWNDLVVAEGRFSVERGDEGTVLRIQRVDDPPWPARWTTEVRADAAGRVVRIGQTKASPGKTEEFLLVRDEGDAVTVGDVGPMVLDADEHVSLNVFPFWAIAHGWFASLAVGETARVWTRDVRFGEDPPLVASPLRIERRPDDGGLRVYAVEATDQGQPVRIEVVLDAEGLPVRATMELQLGTVRFERAE